MNHNQSLRLPAGEWVKLTPARPRGGEIAASVRPAAAGAEARAVSRRPVRHMSGYARA